MAVDIVPRDVLNHTVTLRDNVTADDQAEGAQANELHNYILSIKFRSVHIKYLLFEIAVSNGLNLLTSPI